MQKIAKRLIALLIPITLSLLFTMFGGLAPFPLFFFFPRLSRSLTIHFNNYNLYFHKIK